MSASTREAEQDGVAAAVALLAVDPLGLRGATIRGRACEHEAWIAALRASLPLDVAWRRLPPNLTASRLLGGLDLAATLQAGRPVAERGLLAGAGVVVAPMAERMAADLAGPLAAAIDAAVPGGGSPAAASADCLILLLDEGLDDERAPTIVADRLAFVLHGDAAPQEPAWGREAIAAARRRLPEVAVDEAALEAIGAIGPAFGVASMGLALFVLRAAKASAALAGRSDVTAADVARAAALVIAPRATLLPAPPSTEPETEPETAPEPTPADGDPSDARSDQSPDDGERGEGAALGDQVIAATQAAIPAGLLATLTREASASHRPSGAGRGGQLAASPRKGRPAGVRRGSPGRAGRLAIVETLRAAAPWQPLRRASTTAPASRLLVQRDDFRLARFKQRSETTTIFVVDASGSAALNRLAEVKGAIELILADCYIRRDSVALIAFRGAGAELILPPTRSLTRAKRALAGLPGGGGTPLAAALDAATLLGLVQQRRGATPLLVVLTDGRSNVTRAGRPGRAEAEAETLDAAGALRAASLASLLIDIAPRPQASARQLALAMGARYQPLPFVDARSLSRAVLASTVSR